MADGRILRSAFITEMFFLLMLFAVAGICGMGLDSPTPVVVFAVAVLVCGVFFEVAALVYIFEGCLVGKIGPLWHLDLGGRSLSLFRRLLRFVLGVRRRIGRIWHDARGGDKSIIYILLLNGGKNDSASNNTECELRN